MSYVTQGRHGLVRKKSIPDPGSGSRGQKANGSRIRIRNTENYNAAVCVCTFCSCEYNFCMFQLSEYNSWGVQELVVLLQVDPQNVVVDVVPQQGEHSPLPTQPQVSLELILFHTIPKS